MIQTSFEQIKLGVMQGRLLPKYNGRYQAHPFGYWQDEFPIASKLGLDCIEFIFDYDQYEENPLMTMQGQSEIKEMVQSRGVEVRSICADFFMDCPMHAKEKSQSEAANILYEVLNNVNALDDAIHILIACNKQDLPFPRRATEIERDLMGEIE